MRIIFPYPEIKPLDVPDQNLLGILPPSTVKVEKSEEEIIDETFSDPINSSRLSEILEYCQDVLILVDDYTRSTPTQKILPRLMKELEHGGIKPEGIQRGETKEVWKRDLQTVSHSDP
jgi:lactate racemase